MLGGGQRGGGKRMEHSQAWAGMWVACIEESTGSSLPPQKVGVGPLSPSPQPPNPARASHSSLNRASSGFPEEPLAFRDNLKQPTSDAPDLHFFFSHPLVCFHIPKGAVPSRQSVTPQLADGSWRMEGRSPKELTERRDPATPRQVDCGPPEKRNSGGNVLNLSMLLLIT